MSVILQYSAGYLLDKFTDFAIKWIKKEVKQSKRESKIKKEVEAVKKAVEDSEEKKKQGGRISDAAEKRLRDASRKLTDNFL